MYVAILGLMALTCEDIIAAGLMVTPIITTLLGEILINIEEYTGESGTKCP